MYTFTALHKSLTKAWVAVVAGGLALSFTHVAVAEPYQSPLFLVAPVKPITMLNMSRDHQLYFKLYDDFSDITDARTTVNGVANTNYGKDPDGNPDTGYVHGFNYYGYFDSYKCYQYNTTSNQFDPAATTETKYCNADTTTGQWSGNFLNWASMTRMDAVRKMLYGGMRSTDTTSATVLERAYLPTDAHSFAKYYGGSDLPQLTPFSANISADLYTTGITICNTSDPGTATYSQAATSAVGARPLMRIARGNYSLWASNERYQCRWAASVSGEDGTNENNATASLIPAYSGSPIDGHKLGTGSAAGEYVARVAVCVSGLIATSADRDNEKCYAYNSTTAQKPRGLLQVHGGTQHFGLMTGSYGKNKSGGVLRKAAGSITDEINANGIFQVPTSGNSIIRTLDLLRIYGYRYSDGLYHNGSHTVHTPSASQDDGCRWETSSFSNGQCVNWGNPQAEIYLESLRYLSGVTDPQFDSNDSSYIAGLNRVSTWVDPVSTSTVGNYCAPLNVVQFDASMTSFDADNLTNAPSTIGDIDTATNTVGAAEGIHNNSYFVGQNGTNNNQLCTAKTVGTLASVLGACPDAPRLEGSYKIAGLAYKARSAGVSANRQKVHTYGVSLAASVPNVVVPVPSSASNAKVTILPACRNTTPEPDANCAIVDFKIVSQSSTGAVNSGRLYVNWEDTEHGGDYDQDMWGIIDYSVTSAGVVTVSTDVIASSTPNNMGFGYIISGTTNDGFHVQSGIGNYTGGDCTNCTEGNSAASKSFTVGTSAGALLQPPLYYAAKWGGYEDDALTTAQIADITDVDSYFKAIDPRQLEAELDNFFSDFGRTGSSATVASNSTRLEDETKVYQALFNSEDWSGAMRAYPLNTDATISVNNETWNTDTTLRSAAGRNIYTKGNTGRVNLRSAGWSGSAASALKSALQLTTEATTDNAQKRFNWLLGTDQSGFRIRNKILGDIINSDPAYAGAGSQRYNLLPSIYGSASYEAYVATKVGRTKAVFVGANDGMMHAFNAATGAELFAYIPRGVYSKLASLSDISYQHKYTVDGPLYAGDAFIDSNGDGTKEWRTLVGGTLGAGGRGAYLLDVTDVLATGGEPRIVFDISAEDTSLTYRNDLGYSTGKMLIVPAIGSSSTAGRWVAMLSNGTESVNGTAKLIAIDVETPTSFKSIPTSTQTGNGLSGAALLPNAEGVSTYAYAGDIKGNLWKFDLSSSSIGSWASAYTGGGTPKPLITVVNSAGNLQPITGTPTLGRNSLKMAGSGANQAPSVMVYFGTGRYSETADISSLAVQSIYAIADTNNAINLNSTNRNTLLKAKVITAESTSSPARRTVTPDATPVATEVPAVNWTTYTGWYLDLKFGTAKGERVIVKPVLVFDRLIINTFIPSPNQCDYGGSGWLMELTGVGNRYIGLNVLLGNANIQLTDPILGDLIPIMAGESIIFLGSELSGGIRAIVGEAGAGSRGRMSWRQIK